MTTKDALLEIINEMDVPQMRKQLRPEDLAWLKRNLPFNNSDHPKFGQALKLIAIVMSEN